VTPEATANQRATPIPLGECPLVRQIAEEEIDAKWADMARRLDTTEKIATNLSSCTYCFLDNHKRDECKKIGWGEPPHSDSRHKNLTNSEKEKFGTTRRHESAARSRAQEEKRKKLEADVMKHMATPNPAYHPHLPGNDDVPRYPPDPDLHDLQDSNISRSRHRTSAYYNHTFPSGNYRHAREGE